MKLEICIIQPEKINVFDMEVISALRENGETEETVWSQQLDEKSFAVDSEDIPVFQSNRACLYEIRGCSYIKANVLSKIEIPCKDELSMDEETKIPELSMLPMCQRFLDQEYTFDKMFWTPNEFKEFFSNMIYQMKENSIIDDSVKVIENDLLPKLFKDGVFVHFSFV